MEPALVPLPSLQPSALHVKAFRAQPELYVLALVSLALQVQLLGWVLQLPPQLWALHLLLVTRSARGS